MMEPSTSSENDKTAQQTPKVLYDNGHDNTVFVGDNHSSMPQSNSSRPQTQMNGSTNSYYLNAQPNGLDYPDGEKKQTFRIIENSRL